MSHDEWYNTWTSSNLSTACVVRVTNQCDQSCQHCAFRSKPSNKGQMTPKMCEKINSWVPRSVTLNIMGGEFTILPNYPELLMELARRRDRIRLITNGSWAEKNAGKFFEAMRQIKNTNCRRIEVGVSQDRWHDKESDLAVSLLENNTVGVISVETGDIPKDQISPIGRAWDNLIQPDHAVEPSCTVMSNMIIIEDGMITRCPYGYFPWKHFSEITWHDAQEYIWGWRSEKLSEGMNCHLCMECDSRGD